MRQKANLMYRKQKNNSEMKNMINTYRGLSEEKLVPLYDEKV